VFERYSDSAQSVIAVAGEEARQLGHHHIGTEHLLLGLLSDQRNPTARALPPGTTVQVVRRKVSEAVGTNGVTTGDDLSFTPRAKRALDRAARFSLQRQDDEVGTVHVLLGVLDVEGQAGQVLRGLGVDVGRLQEAARRTADRPPPASRQNASPANVQQQAFDTSPNSAPAPCCSQCSAPLDTALASRTLTARGEGGATRHFVVAYCAGCGAAFAATPTNSTQ
jgi:ATP-dependent Clp protease ATP-binding subunit ClpC